jgi:hypothetical protein
VANALGAGTPDAVVDGEAGDGDTDVFFDLEDLLLA